MIEPDAPSPLVVVAGHICLDIIPVLAEEPDLRPGSLVEIGPAALSAGGPVGNVGLALHRLGVSCESCADLAISRIRSGSAGVAHSRLNHA